MYILSPFSVGMNIPLNKAARSGLTKKAVNIKQKLIRATNAVKNFSRVLYEPKYRSANATDPIIDGQILIFVSVIDDNPSEAPSRFPQMGPSDCDEFRLLRCDLQDGQGGVPGVLSHVHSRT